MTIYERSLALHRFRSVYGVNANPEDYPEQWQIALESVQEDFEMERQNEIEMNELEA